MKTSAVKLRPVTAGDQPFLERLFIDVRREEWRNVNLPEASILQLLRQQFQLQTADWDRNFPQARRQIILVNGQPAGRLYEDWREATQTVHVVDISLLTAFRGMGLGTRLLQDVINAAHRRGYKVSLQMIPGNPAARLYERLGFAAVPDPVTASGQRLFMVCPPPGSAPRSVEPQAVPLAA